MGKLTTPDWIKEGFDSKADWEKAKGRESSGAKKKGKTFKVRRCPKCNSDGVKIVLSNLDSEEESNTGKQWECKKCGWTGEEPKVEKLDEDKFMKYLDEKEEEVA